MRSKSKKINFRVVPDRAYRLSPMWMQAAIPKLHRWHDDHYPDRYFQMKVRCPVFDAYFVQRRMYHFP